MLSKLRSLFGPHQEPAKLAPPKPENPAPWFSPFAQRHLSDEELVQEVAQNAATKVYLIRAFTDEPPEISLGGGGVMVRSESTKLNLLIPYPDSLLALMKKWFPVWLDAHKHAIGIEAPVVSDIDLETPSGERLGRVLGRYNALWILYESVRMQKLRIRPGHLLAIHGLLPTQRVEFNAQLHPLLRDADIEHIIVFSEKAINQGRAEGTPSPETHRCVAGAGAWKLITEDEAGELALDLNAGHTEVCRRIFNLQESYGEDSWAAHHPRFVNNG